MLKLKLDSIGLTERLKRRLASRGNFQSDSINYIELYASIADKELVLLVIWIAIAFGWEIHLVDVKYGIFHDILRDTDKIWIKLPNCAGFTDENKIMRLIKSIYCLRKVPKLRYQWLLDNKQWSMQ